MTEGIGLSAIELGRWYREGELSPVEIADHALRRAEEVHDRLTAFVMFDRAQALQAARASERRWKAGQSLSPLDGVPIAIKDTDAFAGQQRTAGSLSNVSLPPSTEDAPHVANLRKAGAVVIGRTVMADTGWKGLGDSPLTGVARNPWNPAVTPGGSSAGAAISVATRCVPIALGTDGGGSVRIPAAFTGVFGLKPTSGRVPTLRQGALDDMTVQGPLTRCVEDAALTLALMCRDDPRDPMTAALQRCAFERAVGQGVEGLKVGVSGSLGFAPVGDDRLSPLREAAEVLAAAGARVEWVDPPAFDAMEALLTIWAAGYAGATETMSDARFAVLDPGLQDIIRRGRTISAMEEKRAQRERTRLMHVFVEFFTRYDLLLTAVAPVAPPPAGMGVETGDPIAYPTWFDWARHSWTFNLTRMPAVSFPWGLDAAALPQAVQLVAGHYREDLLLRASGVLQGVKPVALPDDALWASG